MDDPDEPLVMEPREMFDDCIIGIARRFNSLFVIYDEEKVLEKLVAQADPEDDDDPETTAREYFEYNIVGAWVGEGTPAFVRPWPER